MHPIYVLIVILTIHLNYSYYIKIVYIIIKYLFINQYVYNQLES